MPVTKFQMKNQAAIDELATKADAVVITSQTVTGSAYQKTAHRVIQELAQGRSNITIATNADNPEIDNLNGLVRNLNLTTKATVRVVAL